jgi:HPr kinase/phosphorylase
MLSKFSASLKWVIDEFELETLHMPQDAEKIYISNTDVSRPSLQFAGFYEIFDDTRMQIIGKTEIAYLNHLTETLGNSELAAERCDGFFALHSPAVVICNSLNCPDYMLAAAQKYGVPLLRTHEDTCEFVSALISQLNTKLAPRITRHGALMEIYGEGILILGQSGIGKSETAVELIARGHRLIADDAVEIRRVSSRALVGSSPKNIRHFMELRGIGIVNARQLFGSGSVKVSQRIDLIVMLESWDEGKQYDRFGTLREYMEIMGVRVPVITIPVKPGRNVAVVTEAAAMNFRLKQMGYDAARDLMHGLGMPDDDLPSPEKIITDTGWNSD